MSVDIRAPDGIFSLTNGLCGLLLGSLSSTCSILSGLVILFLIDTCQLFVFSDYSLNQIRLISVVFKFDVGGLLLFYI
jgi:hypothetical protein